MRLLADQQHRPRLSPLRPGLSKLWELLRTDSFWARRVESLHAIVVASLVVVVFGVLFGVVLGLRGCTGTWRAILVTLYSIPKVTLCPIDPADLRPRLSARIASA